MRTGAPARRRGRRGAAAAGAVMTLGLILGLVTGIIRLMAGSAAVMEAEMTRFAPPERTGLPAAEYPAMAAHIADYLAGRKASFQYTLTGGAGETLLCFHEYELRHMADCRGLIRLDGLVCLAGLGIAAAAAAAAGIRIRRAGESARELREGAVAGARGALTAAMLAAGALALWAAADFDGLFMTFHRLAFRNDLWLLNPRTDLLIRLMPEEMFVDLGVRGGIAAGAGLALLAAGIWAMDKKNRKKEEA